MKNHKSHKQQIKQITKLSLSNIWRNKFLSVATIFIIAIIIFILNIILGVNQVAENSLNSLNEKVDVKIYIKEMATQPKIEELITDLNNLKIVKNVIYISKSEALKKIKTLHPNISETFKKYNLENPLPRSLNITTQTPKNHKELIEFLNKDKYKITLSNIASAESDNSIINSVAKNLEKITNFTKQIIYWVILIFIFGGILIITNSIQITIFNRKNEINIMKFLGGSHKFIQAPFILEAIIYGIISVILSIIMLKITYLNISINVQESIKNTNFIKTITIELIITTIIATISALIAVKKELRRKI